MWKLGDKSQAKQLSNEKQELYNQMNDKNRKAAELIFHFYNKNCPSSVIDLHGLRVDEALTFLSKKVHDCSANGNNQLTVITGIGNNSKEQTPRIKPEVIQFAQRNKITVVYTPNEGQLILELNAVQAERHMNETSCCTIL
ncbi:unnamed protein product [Didymodactylos carnosus]|nr:unnamed protein product [Didymodactylos carnosus]CAF4559841.1 unnamed protein product [Didymodactylos carnosus]